jgi:ATP-binding cassette subfamily B (MDR/TAP) protein 1
MILGLICALGSGIVRLVADRFQSNKTTDKYNQALPLMNIVFGQLVGDFNQYFVPGSGLSEQTFRSEVNKSRQVFAASPSLAASS